MGVVNENCRCNYFNVSEFFFRRDGTASDALIHLAIGGTLARIVMEELAKKVRGDWYDVRQVADDPFKMEEYFAFDKARLESVSEELRLSVERGVTEYKGRKLSELYAFLDSYQYDSRGFETLSRHGNAFSEALYVTLLQRLIAVGVIQVRSSKGAESPQSAPQPGVKDIMLDVQERLVKDPELRKNESVKNILMQMNIYKAELVRMRELEPKILPEKKAAFLMNFRNRFAEITAKIQEHYGVISSEDQKQAASEIEEVSPLKRYDLAQLGKPLFTQAAELSTIRSTLVFAVSEGYKTREIVSAITDRKDRTQLLMRMEMKAYAGILGEGGDVPTMEKAFAAEIIKVFARQISRIPG